MKAKYTKAIAGIILVGSMAGPAMADEIDITSGYYYFGNGIIFSAVAPKGSGSGQWDAFDRIKSEDSFVKGVNTDLHNIYNNQAGPNFTEDMLVGDVGTAGDYYLFQLDTAQSGRGFTSLDRVKIFQNPTAFSDSSGLTGFIETTGVPLFDTGTAHTFKVTANSGNGSGDLWMYVPKALFDPTYYLYLYSELGSPPGVYPGSGSFDEWGALIGTTDAPPTGPGTPPSVPDGGMTLMLLGAGLSGLGYVRRAVKK